MRRESEAAYNCYNDSVLDFLAINVVSRSCDFFSRAGPDDLSLELSLRHCIVFFLFLSPAQSDLSLLEQGKRAARVLRSQVDEEYKALRV